PSTKKEMIVKVNDLSVRSGAGVKYNKLGSLNKGTKVTVISTLSHGWVKIEYKNGYGYIANVNGAYLEEVIENNQEKIAKVIAMIDALPAKIELIHEQQVINVTNAFNNLSIDEQNKIPFPHRASLESAKATISLLKKEIDDKEIVANLIQRIEELKNKKINLQDHETEIKEIRTKYDALGYTRRDEVTNYEEFLRIELDLTHIYEDIIHLESLIKELPSVIENSYGAKVEQAKKEFNLLTDKNQVGVKSELVEKLKDAIIQADRLKEEIVNSNQEVKTLVVDIEQLSIIEDITIDDKDQVFGLMTRYRSLPDNVKFAVDITTVEEAFDKIEGIMAEEVVELIDNLPSIDNLELTDEALLEEARNKYREISSKNNKLVTNIDILTNLEIKMLELQQKEQVIIEIVNKIKNLDNDVTFDNLDEITEKVNEIEALINNSVDEMNQEEKEKFYDSIINIEKLDEIITQIEILNRVSHITTIDEIIELINNIPDDVINIELRHRNNLKDIRNAITKIGAENQISPELMTKVENAEKEIKRLEEDINQVISAIHRLPEIDEITLDDEEQILEAKALYDSKDDRVTHFVNNSSFISKLEDALIKINDLKNLK
ncbi:MAG: SH3 domain-containing protein, partial [Romboutsia sp.]|nr:SH3 domain-containing protein [Romboutsia sp.]